MADDELSAFLEEKPKQDELSAFLDEKPSTSNEADNSKQGIATGSKIALDSSALPLSGATREFSEGMKRGEQLTSPAVAGYDIPGHEIVGKALGLIGGAARAAGTVFNPLGKLIGLIPKGVQSASEAYNGEQGNSIRSLTGERPIESALKIPSSDTGNPSIDVPLNTVGNILKEITTNPPILAAGLGGKAQLEAIKNLPTALRSNASEIANLPRSLLQAGSNPINLALAKKAQDLGVNLPIGTATGAPALKFTQSLLEKAPVSSGMMAEAGKQAEAGLESAKSNFLDTLAQKAGEVETGEKLQGSFDDLKSKFQSQAQKKYSEAKSLIDPEGNGDNFKITTPNVAGQIPDLIKFEDQGIGKLRNNEIISVLKELGDTNKSKSVQSTILDQSGKPIVTELPPVGFSLNSANRASSQLGELIEKYQKLGENVSAKTATGVKIALDKDIDNSILKSGNQAGYDAYKAADDFYSQGQEFLGKIGQKKLNTSDPQVVLDLLTKPNSATILTNLKDRLPANDFNQIKRTLAQKVFEQGVKKFKDDTLKSAFSSDELAAINNIQEVADKIKEIPKEAKSTGGISSIQGATTVANLPLGIASFVTPPILAKIILSPGGRKYLTQAVRSQTGSQQFYSAIDGLKQIGIANSSNLDETSRRLKIKNAIDSSLNQ